MRAHLLTEVLKACGELVGLFRGAGQRTAAAVNERFRGRLAAGRERFDLGELQLALAAEIEAGRAALVALDDRHADAVERGRRLRRQRDRLATDLRGRLQRLKSSLSGAFPDPAAAGLLHPVQRLASAPEALQRQAERLHGLLADPALEVPAPGPGVEVDLSVAASSFCRPMEGLAAALAAVARCDGAVRHAKSRRDEELARLADFARRAGRFCRAFADLAAGERPGRRRGGTGP